jgi:hypothetical protein
LTHIITTHFSPFLSSIIFPAQSRDLHPPYVSTHNNFFWSQFVRRFSYK